MKKILIAILCIFAFASVCFAQGVETVSADRAATDWSSGDVFVGYNYVYNMSNPDKTPSRIIVGDFAFTWKVWIPTTQTYYRHYIVTDPTGTMVYYFKTTAPALSSGDYATMTLANISLPDGDYTMTAVIAGAVSGMAVSDPVHFSVRSY
jgi:hypothetical protein